MLLTNYEINLSLTWSENCVISDGDRAVTFAIADPKIYVSVKIY